MKGRRFNLNMVALGGLMLLGSNVMAQLHGTALISVQPEKVQIGTFYNGKEVTVAAAFPGGYDIALKCTGPEQELRLMKKGRVWGLWMNVEEIYLQNVPSLYMVLTSKSLDRIASAEHLERYRIGYKSFLNEIKLQGSKDPTRKIFEQLIKLNEHDGLYFIGEDILEPEHLQGPYNKVIGKFHLPPKAPPGLYKIELIGFKGNEARLLGSSSLKVEKKGLSAYMYYIAHRHSLLYGFLAVFLAMISGLGIGILFNYLTSQ